MAYRCKACKKEYDDAVASCMQCGANDVTQVLYRVVFAADDQEFPVIVHKSATLGRDDFRGYGEARYRYVHHEQFEVRLSERGWVLRGLPATNPTLLDGVDVTGAEVEVRDGARLRVGALEVELRLEPYESGG